MINRKAKRAFPLNEFSILFSKHISKAIIDIEDLLSGYPKDQLLTEMLNGIRKSVRFIIFQEDEESVRVINKKTYEKLTCEMALDGLKSMKRTGFRADVVDKLKLEKIPLLNSSIIFVLDSVYYRMIIDSGKLDLVDQYIEKYRFHEISEFKNDQKTRRHLFQTLDDISLFKLRILITAITQETKNIMF